MGGQSRAPGQIDDLGRLELSGPETARSRPDSGGTRIRVAGTAAAPASAARTRARAPSLDDVYSSNDAVTPPVSAIVTRTPPLEQRAVTALDARPAPRKKQAVDAWKPGQPFRRVSAMS